MALVLDRPHSVAAPRNAMRWAIPVAIIVAVILRIPFLGAPAGPDEAGFLMVGGQWHSGGTSLYGNYWVDRPPLLIQIFQFASANGGLVALRLIGCLAVAITIAGCAKSASLIAGPRAARWAAVTAAALCTTPLLGTSEVNGELLAAPFVVIGITATIAALKADRERHVRLLAAVAGVAALSALLIKQNFADVFVFMLVAVVVAWHRREITTRHGVRLIGGFAVGVLLTGYAMGILTSLHGTSLSGVFDAMYPFRLQAGRVMAAAGSQYASIRLTALLTACVTSGLVVLIVAMAWGIAAKRLRTAVDWGLITLLAFDAASIAFGGNYWAHYLIQMIVPLAIITGVLIGRHQPLVRPLVAIVALAAVTSWALFMTPDHQPSSATAVSSAISASANPDDTLITGYGHANLNFDAGLESPYQYLWSLPIKTLDPQLHDLGRVLSGPNAPTWFVTWNHVTSWGLNSQTVAATVETDYHQMGHICGRTIYLHDGISRPHLQSNASCSDQPVVAPTTKG